MPKAADFQHACSRRAGYARWALAALMAGSLFLPLTAQAENKVPGPVEREMLVKAALMTLNDANITGNYVVLHAKLSKQFRDQFSPDRLKEAFKGFVEQKADWTVVAAKPVIEIGEAEIDHRGALLLRGYFDTVPNRVTYALDFVPSEGEWKPIHLRVNMKPPVEEAATPSR